MIFTMVEPRRVIWLATKISRVCHLSNIYSLQTGTLPHYWVTQTYGMEEMVQALFSYVAAVRFVDILIGEGG